MRIISGQWRGRPLVAPKGELTRPTADRTRETLFSMLGAYAQAPECVPAWFACCKSEDLRKIVEGLRRGSPLLTQVGRRIVSLDDLAQDVHAMSGWKK